MALPIVNLVSGEVSYLTCFEQRYQGTKCGQIGYLWEKRETYDANAN